MFIEGSLDVILLLPVFGIIGTIGAGLAAASAAANLIRSIQGGPDFPLTEADVNRLIDLQLNRALSDVASGTRRRLIGAGQEGSGTIDAAIKDAQNRVRRTFEEQREKALQLLKQAQFQRDQAAFNQLGETLGGLTSIGTSLGILGSDLGQSSNVGIPGISPGLTAFVNQFSSNQQSLPQVQPLQPRGLSPLTGPNFNQPLDFVNR